MGSEDIACDRQFAAALTDAGQPLPDVLAKSSNHRFAVYRNNVAIRHIEALEAGFPAVRETVGETFFAAMARAFFAAHPPTLPILTFYGDALPEFLRHFPPVADIAYLPDLAELEARHTRAAYAAEADSLPSETLARLAPDGLTHMRVALHPSVSIFSSTHPVATIWAMNTGALPVAPIDDWFPEDVLIARPQREVDLRRLPPGGAAFLRALADGENLGEAAAAAMAGAADFDLAFALAGLFNFGLVTRLSFATQEGL